jgi:lipoprotein NlpD
LTAKVLISNIEILQEVLLKKLFRNKIYIMHTPPFLRYFPLVLTVSVLQGCVLLKPISEAYSNKPEPVYCEARPTVAAPPPVAAAAPEPAPAPAPIVVVNSAPASGINWLWPADGRVITNFDGRTMKGINFQGAVGDPVYAVADGVVVYAGNGLKQPGKFIIIKHNDIYLSAYAYNRKILVKENEKVVQGQRIAEMGNSATKNAKLYFEVREVGKLVDPLNYLPSR